MLSRWSQVMAAEEEEEEEEGPSSDMKAATSCETILNSDESSAAWRKADPAGSDLAFTSAAFFFFLVCLPLVPVSGS